jgi:hypothetical protein
MRSTTGREEISEKNWKHAYDSQRKKFAFAWWMKVFDRHPRGIYVHDQTRYSVSAMRDPSRGTHDRQKPDTKEAVFGMKEDMNTCVHSCGWQGRLD